MGGFASSKILEIHGERMIKRTFDPGSRIELHQKDLNLALSTARGLGMSLPNTATAQELFNACSKPEEWREYLFSRHWELCIAEMTQYHLDDCRRQHNNVGRILKRTEKEIADLESRGL